VKIPAGVNSGNQIGVRVRAMPVARGGPSGDLIINISVAEA